MTLIVGILCEDGVVIGADSAVTFSANSQLHTIEQKDTKIYIHENQVIHAGTGSVGLSQRFFKVICDYWSSGKYKNPANKHSLQIGKELCTDGLRDFDSTFLRPGQLGFGALCAFYKDGGFHLCEFATNTLQPEFKTKNLWYVSMGNGQLIADTLLAFIRRTLWRKNQLPTVDEATFAALWVLQITIDINTGGVNGPPVIATLKKVDNQPHAEFINDGKIAEHDESIKALEKHIENFPNIFEKQDVKDVPPPPPGP
jgi:20S proteasome alpha/beta subunit